MKELSHPHVIQYYDSFFYNQQLIIVMEYCEGSYLTTCNPIKSAYIEGDLAYHINLKKQNNSRFSEKIIMNWFL